MERYPLDPEKMENMPENEGQLNVPEKKSKRKRSRKTNRAPLEKLIQKETAEDLDKQAKLEKTTDDKPEKLKEIEPEQPAEELILPEVEDLEKSASDYEGELVIDHNEQNEVGSEDEVNAFEALLESSEADDYPETAPSVAEVAAENSENSQEDTPPPIVAPPLPFFTTVEAVPQPEQAVAFEAPAVYPIPESQPRTNSLGGRLSEEWAAIRRRNQENQLTVTESEAADRAYYAEKRGLSRGVVSGGLVGYLIGRRGKRSLQREAAASLKNRDKTIEALSKERGLALSQSEERLSALKRTQNELGEMVRRTKNAVGSTFRETPPKIETTRVVEVPVIKTMEQIPEKPADTILTPETTRQIADNSVERQSVKPENIPPEDRPITAETYQMPEGRRVETSTWHRIEIDEKTGRAVESPALAYGEAFKREQSVERLAREAAKAQTAAKVGMTLLYSGTEESKTPLLPPTDPIRKRTISAANVRRETAFAAIQVARGVTKPATWGIAVSLVLILILLGII